MNEGHVYVVDYGVAVKVGKSVDPDIRVRQLREFDGNPQVRTFVSPLIEEHHKAEKAMHKALSEKRIRGEYFNIPFEDAVDLLKRQKFNTIKMTKARRAKEEREMLAKVKYIREWRKT